MSPDRRKSTRARLPTSEHKLAKVFVFGDQDRGPTVCLGEYVKVGRAKRQFRNGVNLASRPAKSVHERSPNTLVGKVSHSSASRVDNIEAEDIGGVSNRGKHTFPSQVWI